MRKLSMDELDRIAPVDYQTQTHTNLLLVLDNIRSMNNIGSAFRTADAFGIPRIYLCGITAQPPHREIHKTALGATETVEWKYFENTVEALQSLKNEGFTLVAVEQTDEKVYLQDFKIDQTQKYAFIFGNEVFGVSDEAIVCCDLALEIPQFGSKHSFNISVALGIVMWEAIRQGF